MSNACREYEQLSRRQVLTRGTVATAAALTMPAWMPRIAMAQGGPDRDVLINIYLGGGADGLSVCVPYGDPNYYVHRQSEAIRPPDATGTQFKCRDLDGFFGVSRAWDPLLDVFQDDKLLFVHASGAAKQEWSRSHFDAQRWLDLGKPNDFTIADGWLGRHLQTKAPMNATAPLRGISMSYGMMDLMRGGPNSLPIPDPNNYGFAGWFPNYPEVIQWLKETYRNYPDPLLRQSGIYTVGTVEVLNAIDFDNYAASGGAIYNPDSGLARALKMTAAMMKAEIGLEAVTMDYGGWDTHEQQGTNDGYMHGKMAELAAALKAFYQDLLASNKTNWTLVITSEFGRTVRQNNTGTDHGKGSVMTLLGPNVLGGRVLADWPGLAEEQLFEGQDLKVTIDYRDIVAEVVSRRLKNTAGLPAIFPSYTPTFRNVVAA